MLFFAILLAAAYTASALVIKPATCPAVDGMTFPAGSSCTAECGRTRPGGNYEELPLGSFAACAQACSDDPRCLTAQYRSDNRVCYKKNFINDPAPSDVSDGVLCRTCAQGQTVPGTTCVSECGITRPGSDFRQISFPQPRGFQRCAQECSRDPMCTTAQYRADNRVCYLKRQTNEPRPNANVNGIVCRGPGSAAPAAEAF